MPDQLKPAAEDLAALRLVAGGRSYSQVAADLAIDESAVRQSARTAIDAFAGASVRNLTESERSRIADWLLAQTDDEPLVVTSPAAREYAMNATAAAHAQQGVELNSLPLSGVTSPKEFAVSSPVAKATPRRGNRAGITLLALGTAAILIVVLAASGVFSSTSEQQATSTASLPLTSTSTQAQQTPSDGQLAGWKLSKRFDLVPVTGASGRGIAGLETKGKQSALLVAGTGLKPGIAVGIWVTGGAAPGLVGFQRVTAKGEFTAVGAVPAGAPSADRLIVTEEQISKNAPPPTSPGRVLLSSPFGL